MAELLLFIIDTQWAINYTPAHEKRVLSVSGSFQEQTINVLSIESNGVEPNAELSRRNLPYGLRLIAFKKPS